MARANNGTDMLSPKMCRYLRYLPPLRIWVPLVVLFLNLMGQDTEPQRWRIKSTKFTYSYRSSCETHPGLKIASRCFLKQRPPRRLRLRVWNRLLRASWLALPLWKQVQPLALAAPTRQDHGTDPDIAMAPQPLGLSGPMALGHLMTVEIQDEDLIHSQAPKMNKHEVPFYSGSLANNTTKGLQSGSIISGKNPICQHTTNLSEFIAKQFPCRSGLFLKHEPNVKTLLLDFKMMVSSKPLIAPSAAPIQIYIIAVNPNQLKTERLENSLRLCGELAD